MAARGDQLDMLQYLHEQQPIRDELTCAEAARGGNLEVLKQLYDQGCPLDAQECAYYAYEHRRVATLQWLLDNYREELEPEENSEDELDDM